MMRLLSLGLTAALLATAGVAQAELKSGLQAGDSVGAYNVEKVAGNPTDDVEEGQKLCYRCKLGNRPVVTIFARSTDPNVVKLVSKLDGFVAANEEKKAASFVNLLGDDVAALKTDAGKLVDASKAQKVAVVIPLDHKNGPGAFNINPEADVTVLIYNQGKVSASHAYKSGELNDEAIAVILADADKIVQ